MLRREYFTSSSSWLAAAALTLDRHGMDGARVLADTGIHLEDFVGGERRAPTDIIREAWQLVAEKTGDPAIGIRAAFDSFNPADWQSLGLAVLCSETIRHALRRISHYFEVVSDAADTQLEETAGHVRFIASTFGDPQAFGYEAIEYGLGALLVLLREIFPREMHPLRVELLRPQELASSEFAELLGCPVTFGCERESILFSAAVADEKLLGSNEALARYQDSFSTCPTGSVGEVVGYGVVEQHHVLADEADLRAQARKRVFGDPPAIEQYLARVGLVEARQQAHDRGLAAAQSGRTRTQVFPMAHADRRCERTGACFC